MKFYLPRLKELLNNTRCCDVVHLDYKNRKKYDWDFATTSSTTINGVHYWCYTKNDKIIYKTDSGEIASCKSVIWVRIEDGNLYFFDSVENATRKHEFYSIPVSLVESI